MNISINQLPNEFVKTLNGWGPFLYQRKSVTNRKEKIYDTPYHEIAYKD